MMKRYTTVIFDLDGTLRVSRPRFMDALAAHVADFGYPLPSDRLRELERWVHYYWARSPELQNDRDRYGENLLWLRFIHRLLHMAGYEVSEEETQRIIETFAEAYNPDSVIMPGVRETLEVLQNAGVTLGVLSNRKNAFRDELERLGIADYFRFTFAAGEVGYWKPDPRIFKVALEHAGVPPHQAMYVGDNYYADVQGARAAGLDVILVNDRGVFDDVDCPKVRDVREIIPAVLPAAN